MINRKRNKDLLTEVQKNIRNKELIGLPLTPKERKLMEWKTPIYSEVFSIKNTTKYHDRITPPPSPIELPEDEELLDLDEVLKELMGEGGDEVDDELEDWLRGLDDDYEDIKWSYYSRDEVDY